MKSKLALSWCIALLLLGCGDKDADSGSNKTTDPDSAKCGNKILETGETCDDGNTTDGDGCSATCQKEGEGDPVCGNEIVETGEKCDDGNTTDGDGCSSTCQNEDAPVVETVLAKVTDTCDAKGSVCKFAPSMKDVKGASWLEHLGANVLDDGVNFAVYSEHATRMEVLLFDSAKSDTPSTRVPLTKNADSSVWTAFVKGLGYNQYYGYIAWGPNWEYKEDFEPGSNKGFLSDIDANNNRFNPNKLLIDPYTMRVSRDFDWTKGTPLSGETKSGRVSSSWGAAGKSVVVKSKYIWSDNETTWRVNRDKGDAHVGHASNDTIIYTVHPKDLTKQAPKKLTINDLEINITSPGSYRGIGEIAPYLKDLGVTTLNLMPINEKPENTGYFGFSTINYFAPEWQFAAACMDSVGFTDDSKCAPNDVIDEFKWMVDQLHQNDIEIMLMMDYSMTGEGLPWKHSKRQEESYKFASYYKADDQIPTYSFRGLDNSAYYDLTKDSNTLIETATLSNKAPFRRLIVDSLRYWVQEMHIDGFIINNGPELADSNNYDDLKEKLPTSVIQDIINDAMLQKHHTKLIIEPYSATCYAPGDITGATNNPNYQWSELNDIFAVHMIGFINKDQPLSASINDVTIPASWLGSSAIYSPTGRKPYHSVNFLTAYYNFTLNDYLTYNKPHNGCGKLHDVCCKSDLQTYCYDFSATFDDRSNSWCSYGCHDNCENDPESGYCSAPDKENLKRQLMRALFTLQLISNGTPMIMGGDEWMRTQYGNNYPFSDSSDNNYRWFRWDDWTSNNAQLRMHDFVKKMITIRKQFKEFLAPSEYGVKPEYQWPVGNSAQWSGRSVGLYYKGTEKTPSLFIMINMELEEERTFLFPEADDWKILADTQIFFDDEGTGDGAYFGQHPNDNRTVSHNIWLNNPNKTNASYVVKPRSIVIVSK